MKYAVMCPLLMQWALTPDKEKQSKAMQPGQAHACKAEQHFHYGRIMPKKAWPAYVMHKRLFHFLSFYLAHSLSYSHTHTRVCLEGYVCKHVKETTCAFVKFDSGKGHTKVCIINDHYQLHLHYQHTSIRLHLCPAVCPGIRCFHILQYITI